jgi:hypothetical protein
VSRRRNAGQYALRGMDRDRLWSRLPDRTGDPLGSPDGCITCSGTGLDLMANPPSSCRPCLGTGLVPMTWPAPATSRSALDRPAQVKHRDPDQSGAAEDGKHPAHPLPDGPARDDLGGAADQQKDDDKRRHHKELLLRAADHPRPRPLSPRRLLPWLRAVATATFVHSFRKDVTELIRGAVPALSGGPFPAFGATAERPVPSTEHEGHAADSPPAVASSPDPPCDADGGAGRA